MSAAGICRARDVRRAADGRPRSAGTRRRRYLTSTSRSNATDGCAMRITTPVNASADARVPRVQLRVRRICSRRPSAERSVQAAAMMGIMDRDRMKVVRGRSARAETSLLWRSSCFVASVFACCAVA